MPRISQKEFDEKWARYESALDEEIYTFEPARRTAGVILFIGIALFLIGTILIWSTWAGGVLVVLGAGGIAYCCLIEIINSEV